MVAARRRCPSVGASVFLFIRINGFFEKEPLHFSRVGFLATIVARASRVSVTFLIAAASPSRRLSMRAIIVFPFLVLLFTSTMKRVLFSGIDISLIIWAHPTSAYFMV